MKEGKTMKRVSKIVVLGGACLLGSALVRAQAPPGPLTPPPADAASASAPAPAPPKKPEVKPRKNILGIWKFNKDESDDGRAKLRQSREAENTNRGGGGGGYGGPHVGWPGGPMGGPGYGGQRYPQGGGDQSDHLGDIVNPPHEMKLSQNYDKDPEILLSDDRQHRTAFFTDGRKLEKEKDPSYKEVAARWDGSNLVTDEKGAHGGKLSRTFELSSDGKQLIENIRVSDSKGNHAVLVRYVYDATDEDGGSYGGS
jgi:hypothetical protein